jgi:hypothetical protein
MAEPAETIEELMERYPIGKEVEVRSLWGSVNFKTKVVGWQSPEKLILAQNETTHRYLTVWDVDNIVEPEPRQKYWELTGSGGVLLARIYALDSLVTHNINKGMLTPEEAKSIAKALEAAAEEVEGDI